MKDGFSLIKDMVEVSQKFLERKAYLSSEIAAQDKKAKDLLHYMEIENLNAAQLVKAAVALRDVQRRRREVKNELWYITSYCGVIERSHLHCMPNIEKSMRKEAKYEVRTTILKEVFGCEESTIVSKMRYVRGEENDED